MHEQSKILYFIATKVNKERLKNKKTLDNWFSPRVFNYRIVAKIFHLGAWALPGLPSGIWPFLDVRVGLNFDPIEFGILFWPHWISTLGLLIQRAVLGIQRIFHVELRPPPPPETGVIVLRPYRRITFWSPLNRDHGSGFHFKLWHRALLPFSILTPSHHSTLNWDPVQG